MLPKARQNMIIPLKMMGFDLAYRSCHSQSCAQPLVINNLWRVINASNLIEHPVGKGDFIKQNFYISIQARRNNHPLSNSPSTEFRVVQYDANLIERNCQIFEHLPMFSVS